MGRGCGLSVAVGSWFSRMGTLVHPEPGRGGYWTEPAPPTPPCSPVILVYRQGGCVPGHQDNRPAVDTSGTYCRRGRWRGRSGIHDPGWWEGWTLQVWAEAALHRRNCFFTRQPEPGS